MELLTLNLYVLTLNPIYMAIILRTVNLSSIYPANKYIQYNGYYLFSNSSWVRVKVDMVY